MYFGDEHQHDQVLQSSIAQGRQSCFLNKFLYVDTLSLETASVPFHGFSRSVVFAVQML